MGCFEGTVRICGSHDPHLHVLSPLYDNYRLGMRHVNGVMLQWSPVSNGKCVLEPHFLIGFVFLLNSFKEGEGVGACLVVDKYWFAQGL
jgi:hypothetical protein